MRIPSPWIVFLHRLGNFGSDLHALLFSVAPGKSVDEANCVPSSAHV